jgi:ribosome recycling factor
MTSQYNNQFAGCVEWLRVEYQSVQAGQANPSMLDGVRFEAYGNPNTRIVDTASVTLEDPRTLRVSPWDKDHTKSIESAIREAGLPFSLVTDSAGLRVIVPQMTEETRKKILKHAKELHEEARVRVRKTRQEANDTIDKAEKAKEITEDDSRRYKGEIQKMVDDANHALDVIFTQKEESIMTV